MARPAVPHRTAGPKCPICRKSVSAEHRPFCSTRCRDIDLARWLGGGYVIGGQTLDVADDWAAPSDGGPAGEASRDDDERP